MKRPNLRAAAGLLHRNDSDAAAWRDEQADVDADIEGLSRDPEADRRIAQMDADGLPIERQIAQLKAYFTARRDGKPPAP